MKILIQDCDNKFINNASYCTIEDTIIHKGVLRDNLYRLHYAYRPDVVIFIESLLNNEIYQYITEFFQNIKIFIYHDKKPNIDIIQTYNMCSHLVDSQFDQINNTIQVPYLVNTELYTNNHNSQKSEDIVCFLDGLNDLPLNLKSYLYPNTKLKIKLFNNKNIRNAQNLGLINEKEKSVILADSGSFIDINGNYIAEAMLSNCSVFSIDELNELQPNKFTKIPEFTPYNIFLKSIL